MTEPWGFCERCYRWFYTQHGVAASEPARCPVCDAVPAMVRHRHPETEPTVS